jgi:tetratricopeptide (TPR) repeat protein
VNALLSGVRAFRRNAFRTAEGDFSAAIDRDSAFGLAAWWLHNAWRWRVTGEPDQRVDLQSLLERHGGELPTRDSLLIGAQLAPSATRRFEIYREIIERYPRDGMAASIYAEALLNRGALSGVPIESTIRELENAVAKDSAFGPALGNLVWAYIREGNRGGAERMFQHLSAVSAGPDEVEVYQVPLLGFAIAERFYPTDSIAAVRANMQGQPDMMSEVLDKLRLAAMLGLAGTQADFASMFLMDQRLPRERRAGLFESRGLALMALGRIDEALRDIDSAATLFRQPAARLEAAEWRIIGRLLGVPGISEDDVAGTVEALRRLETDPAVALRAKWALGLAAVINGDSAALARRVTELRAARPDTVALRLGTLLEALQQATQGQSEIAVETSAPLLAYDSAAQGGDPFARAVLHMKRAEWLETAALYEAADSARLWYEHFEVIRIPRAEMALAADIDWALGTVAMWLRGTRAATRGQRDKACGLLARVARLWEGADASVAQPRDTALTLMSNLRCPP